MRTQTLPTMVAAPSSVARWRQAYGWMQVLPARLGDNKKIKTHLDAIYNNLGPNSFVSAEKPWAQLSINLGRAAVDVIDTPNFAKLAHEWPYLRTRGRIGELGCIASKWTQHLGLDLCSVILREEATPKASACYHGVTKSRKQAVCEFITRTGEEMVTSFVQDLGILAHEVIGHGLQYKFGRYKSQPAESLLALRCLEFGRLSPDAFRLVSGIFAINLRHYIPIDDTMEVFDPQESVGNYTMVPSANPYFTQPVEVHARFVESAISRALAQTRYLPGR